MNTDNKEAEFRESLKLLSDEIRQTDSRPYDKVLAAIQECRHLIAESRDNGELGKWEEYFLSHAQAAVNQDWLQSAIASIYKAIDFSKMDDSAVGTA